LNPIDNIENVIVEILVSADVVRVEHQLALNSVEDMLNGPIHRTARSTERKSSYDPKQESSLELSDACAGPSGFVRGESAVIPQSTSSDLFDHGGRNGCWFQGAVLVKQSGQVDLVFQKPPSGESISHCGRRDHQVPGLTCPSPPSPLSDWRFLERCRLHRC
jgi:hypothetical protein